MVGRQSPRGGLPALRNYMHAYLEAVGFKNVRTREDINHLISKTVLESDEMHRFTDEKGRTMAEFTREYAPDVGLTVVGEFDSKGEFHPDYFFPFMAANTVSSEEEMNFERHAGKESYAGACDDPRVGATLIFYLINMGDLQNKCPNFQYPENATSVSFSILSRDARVILPAGGSRRRTKEYQQDVQEHKRLVNAARVGDEDAIESLTMEDLDTYTMITQRLEKEDILTIVETSFAPFGMECDQYSFVGLILDTKKVVNEDTREEIYQIKMEICDIVVELCINADSLMGVPEKGRRIRGTGWLQGYVDFE